MTQRQPRLVDDGFLKWLRKLPCTACNKPPPSDAAHIRFGSVLHGKRMVGLGEKPDDRWALPLCRGCHFDQHKHNEFEWWQFHHRTNPLTIASVLYGMYGGDGGHVRKKRKPRHIAAPKGFSGKRKIAQRTKPWPKGRKIRNRGSSGLSRRGGSGA